MSDLISRLANLGVAKKDIYTSSISINPTSDYQDGKRINTGYNVSNHVTIKINNLDNVGKVVDAAYHTRDGNEGNSRKGGSDHSERNNIPGRTAVAAEERVIIGMTAGKAGYKQQYSEIEQYGQQNINSVHVIFLSANVLKIVEIA
mgnify:CR=1 FL=1